MNANKQYPQYPNYKDSGVDWLGQIPAHWEVKRIKMLSQVKRGASPRPIDDPKYFSEEGAYSWVRISDVTASDHYLLKTEQRLSNLGASLSVKLKPSSLFLSIAGSVGKPMITAIKCCIHDGFVYFPNYSQNIEYLYRIFEAGQLFIGLGKHGTQLNLNTETVGNIYIPVPPLAEQQQIADYLDHKTALIEQAVALKQQQIALLQERLQILIQNAVTKGLNPQAPLKNSNIDWLGQIPAHWEVKKLKYCMTFSNDKLESKLTSLRYIGMESIESGNGKLNKLETNAEGLATIFEVGDILFGKLRPYLAKVYLAEFNGICSTEFLVCKLSKKMLSSYVSNLFLSNRFIEIVNSSTYGSKMPRASVDYIANIFIPIPPLTEQQQIADYLDKKSTETEQAINLMNEQIKLLQEYKNILINEAVTGKIDLSHNRLGSKQQ